MADFMGFYFVGETGQMVMIWSGAPDSPKVIVAVEYGVNENGGGRKTLPPHFFEVLLGAVTDRLPTFASSPPRSF